MTRVGTAGPGAAAGTPGCTAGQRLHWARKLAEITAAGPKGANGPAPSWRTRVLSAWSRPASGADAGLHGSGASAQVVAANSASLTGPLLLGRAAERGEGAGQRPRQRRAVAPAGRGDRAGQARACDRVQIAQRHQPVQVAEAEAHLQAGAARGDHVGAQGAPGQPPRRPASCPRSASA